MRAHHLPYRPFVALAAVAGLTAVLATGCRSTASAPSHTPYVRLTGGTYHGTAWQLFAWEQESKLCMELLPGGSDPGHHPTADLPSWQPAGGGGCAFDRSDPSSDYYASSTGPNGSGFSFGPVPATATRIRTATHETLATSPLPPGKGLPAGRYWIHLMPAGWPSEAEGTALDRPQPLDARGGTVAFRAF